MTAPTSGKHARLAPTALNPYHRNPRRGDVGAIVASLRASGQYRPIVVNKGTLTGRPSEVLAGNHTVAAFAELRKAEPGNKQWDRVDCWVIDVDDETATRIVAADNRIAQLGWIDDTELLRLLDDLPVLDGTGYTDDDVADIRALVEEMNLPPALDNGIISDPAPPERPDDGLIPTLDVQQQGDNYADRSTRLVVLSLPIAQFVWTQRALAAYRNARGLDSNNDAVMDLLSVWLGEQPPSADAVIDLEAVAEAADLDPTTPED
jgi:hypothetical protein